MLGLPEVGGRVLRDIGGLPGERRRNRGSDADDEQEDADHRDGHGEAALDPVLHQPHHGNVQHDREEDGDGEVEQEMSEDEQDGQ